VTARALRRAITSPFALSALVLALLTALRIAVLIATPLNLGPDEAQYWSWSLTPAFGYFSKPPMIAWLIGATTGICGDGEACIRIAAPLMHAGTACLVFLAARALYDETVGLWAAAAYALMPGTTFSSLLITTDVPLLFFWTLALWSFAELRRAPKIGWAIALGVSLDLGLLSKYAMLYFILGLAIALLPTRKGRSLAISRWGLIAAASATLVFAPNVLWNLAHSFATVTHTASNANWTAERLFNIAKAGEFIAAQAGIIGPIAAVMLISGFIKGWRDRNLDHPDALLLSLSLPILAIITAQAFISRANANWAAPAFIALAILISAWGVRQRRTPWLAANIAVNALLALALSILAVSPAVVAAVGQENSVKRLRGWNEAGRSIVALASSAPFTAILSDDREDMASLYYYTRARAHPLRMWPKKIAGNEYEASYPLALDEASNVLFVTRRSDPKDVLDAFAKKERIATLETRLDVKRTRVFFLYALKEPRDPTLFPKFFDRPSTD